MIRFVHDGHGRHALDSWLAQPYTGAYPNGKEPIVDHRDSHDTPLPPDDLSRALVDAGPSDAGICHLSLAGDTYSILVSGDQTAGRYTLIEMRVPSGGGPPLHRHDFEEMFSILEGEVEFTFRGERTVVVAGRTVNIPANAPHHFRNASTAPARMLCMCAPAGQDAYFKRVADAVDGPDSPAPVLDAMQINERRATATALASTYRTEFL